MRRMEQLRGLRLMKFEDVYGRSFCGELSQFEAAEILGASERTLPRWRGRYEAAQILDLSNTRYWDFTVKHFHEKLVSEHPVKRSYNWVRLTLQAHGGAPRRLPGAPCLA